MLFSALRTTHIAGRQWVKSGVFPTSDSLSGMSVSSGGRPCLTFHQLFESEPVFSRYYVRAVVLLCHTEVNSIVLYNNTVIEYCGMVTFGYNLCWGLQLKLTANTFKSFIQVKDCFLWHDIDI